jgi:hypothetical protein
MFVTKAVGRSSFRDPSGRVFESDGVLYRSVASSYRPHYDALFSSGLYESLTSSGLLVPHEEVDPDIGRATDVYRVIRPERIPFISYPYEWSFSALKDAALATLRIQSTALDHGMSLKDASAFNVQFRNGEPVLIDTLSFEIYEEETPWAAYRQFCQHFVTPLALMSYVDVRLGLLAKLYVDGIPLDLGSNLLPRRSRFSIGTKLHIHSHAKSMQKHSHAGVGVREMKGRFSRRAFRGFIDSLTSTIKSYQWQPSGTEWADYYSEADHYSHESLEVKKRVVATYLDELRPSLVFDLGANTGVFSRLASERGALTVSLDADPAVVEVNYRKMVANDEDDLLPLVFDLTNPSPGIGWANAERDALDRRGVADVGMALALIHHLVIGNNVPFALLASYFSSLCRSLIIEFVPKDDPKVQGLLASREDVFGDFNEKSFEEAFEEHFAIGRRTEISGTGRSIYLMTRR